MKLLSRGLTIVVGLSILSCVSTQTLAWHRHHHIYSVTHRHTVRTVTHYNAPSHIYGNQNLVAEINQILRRTNVDVGVQIKSMKTGEILYSRNEQHLYSPASILKMLTAEAALLFLGPDYKFPTKVVTDAKTKSNGVINGNVYVVQSGDPSLTYYDLTGLIVALKAQQIQTINGQLFVDNSAYDQVNYAPGWVWDDTRYCYAAPINAGIVNHNCVSFKIAPAKYSGQLASVIANPRYYLPSIQNSLITGSGRSCYMSLRPQANSTISLSGCMPKGYARGASVVVTNVLQYDKSLIADLFKRYGIKVNGQVLFGTAPQSSYELAVHESKPLHNLITQMLKKSDNIIAGSLLKKLGQLYSKQPGSWANGGNAVKQLLSKQASVDTSSMSIIDGSGLSRDNRVKPAQMMQLLNFAFHNYATSYEFISALPIAGVDGTLKHRLYNIARKVRAKTGTEAIEGVVSLAGYTVTKDKEPIAFVIIFNGKHGDIWKYREIEDAIVTALTNYSRT